jgi:hypothetical protein
MNTRDNRANGRAAMRFMRDLLSHDDVLPVRSSIDAAIEIKIQLFRSVDVVLWFAFPYRVYRGLPEAPRRELEV